ncbi:LysR family transcriptional regulator [Mesorhizobium australicum]|jgi:LysR family nitrogen assimilation transcriptional regulator|uniref:Transcriptional regulator, LysR family n=1 Tax=Mesorhizobium australicum TaxID=536018 RepID=A0A1X7PWE2_9HYPH|nr:LysR family transcriptional regulator [Mesorhizobium australicum]SMH55921.1 transcriptional regulator, LysR family [Mesorhizobium australicum]
MDLRQIRYFVAAYETGSLSAAAGRLNCTAPGVSQQMSSLEARLGTRLFERTSRGVDPTAAGNRFYIRCLAVLKAVSEAEIELQDFKIGLSGSISAGFAPGLARSVLPQVLARFTREFPRIDIEIASGTADVLVSETSAGGLDFYVGQFTQEHLGVMATHVGRYPVSLLSGARRGLAPMQPVRLKNLAPLKLSVPSGTNSLRPRIEEAIRSGEIVVERTISIDSLSAGFHFVSQTDWSSILPFWIGLQELGNDRLTINPIEQPALHVDVALIVPTRRPMTRPSQLFYDYFRQELQRMDEEWRRIVSPALSADYGSV